MSNLELKAIGDNTDLPSTPEPGIPERLPAKASGAAVGKVPSKTKGSPSVNGEGYLVSQAGKVLCFLRPEERKAATWELMNGLRTGNAMEGILSVQMLGTHEAMIKSLLVAANVDQPVKVTRRMRTLPPGWGAFPSNRWR
jgi:hypothetical protein